MLVSFTPNIVTNRYQASKSQRNIHFGQLKIDAQEVLPDKDWLNNMLRNSDFIERLRIRFLNPNNTISKEVAIATLKAFKAASDGADNLSADDAIKWIQNYTRT